MAVFVWLFSLLLLLALVVMIRLGRIARRLMAARRTTEELSLRCECGYLQAGLPIPRCPECGRVVGFDATAQELGLTLEQLQRVQATMQQRKAKRAAAQ